MCVEDDHDIQFLLNMALSSIGDYDVCLASNGFEALSKLEYLCPQLIIVDWMMPDMNGLELSTEIRKNKHLEKVKILLISAKSNVHELLGTNSYLFDEIIIKPFDPLTLPLVVKKHLLLTL